MSSTPNILCPECSECIGEVIIFIDAAKMGYYRKHIASDKKLRDSDPAKLELNSKAAPDIGFILDSAMLKLMCCRTHGMSTEIFNMLK